MGKTFALLFSLLCILSAQATNESNQSTSSTPETNTAETFESDDDTQDSEPDLNCILFGNIGCDATCSSISYLYGDTTKATCTSDQQCICNVEKQTSIESLWYEKLEKNEESEKVLQKIIDDPELAEQVKEILQRFPRTPAETWLDLSNECPNADDYTDLYINDKNIPVERFVSEDDTVNRKELQSDISAILKRALNAKVYPIDKINYHDRLSKFIKSHSDANTHVLNEIHKTGNVYLRKYLTPEQRRTRYDFTLDSEKPSFDLVPDYVTSSVINEFVKYIELAKRAKSTPTKQAKKTDPKTKPKPKPAEKPQPKTPVVPKPRRKYETPAIPDFTDIQNYSTQFQKSYPGDEGKVEIEITKTGATKLNWQIDNVKVKLARFTDNEIQQNWKFQDGTEVELTSYPKGYKHQYWNIAGKKFKYYEEPNGSITLSGDATDEERARYEEEIKSWCDENRHLFPPEHCIIYNQRSINSTKPSPAQNQVAEANEKYRIDTLENFTSIENYDAPFKRQFKTENFDIDVEIEQNGALKLDWQKDDIKVNLYTLLRNKIIQSWKFGNNAEISITYYGNGVRDQLWKIGEKTYKFLEAPNGEIIPSGDATPKDIAEYKRQIDSWCKENHALYPIEYCTIYDKRSPRPVQISAYTPADDTFKTPPLPNFTSIDKITGPFKRTYNGQDGTVQLERTEKGTLMLQWFFGNTLVNLTTYSDGKIEQLWKFGDALITIVNHTDGSRDQFWDIFDDQYEFHQSSEGQASSFGMASGAQLEKFENKIKTWCKNKKTLYPTEYCVIYERNFSL